MYTDKNEAPNAEGKLWKKILWKISLTFFHIHRMKGKKEEVEKNLETKPRLSICDTNTITEKKIG